VKRVLFDENMPRKLRHNLSAYEVRTVQEEGWSGFENGNLLRRASGVFDVLLTADQRMRYQQNISQFAVAVVVIETADTTIENLRSMLRQIQAALDTAKPGVVTIVSTA
jgi:hypothetical protein